MKVTFYGVRGSCPCAGPGYREYGGNTSCLLVEVDGEDPIIVDLGTGLRQLGEDLAARCEAAGRPLRATALLSHLHYDHILGLPFFRPLFVPGAVLDVHGPRQPDGPLREVLLRVVQPPFFPLHMGDFQGSVNLLDTGDEDFTVGAVGVRARAIPHVGHTLGFRIEADGVAVAYLSDHQAPTDGRHVADAVLELCQGADLVIHDAQYDDAEFAVKADWGHSTVAYAVRVAAQAQARSLLLYHHDPLHKDRDIDELLAVARSLPEARQVEVAAAREGLSVELAS